MHGFLLWMMAAHAAGGAAPTALSSDDWAITFGWPGSSLALAPVAGLASVQDTPIGLHFLPDGHLREVWLVPVDRTQGCSNSFGGFTGTWSLHGDQLEVVLIERTRSEVLPAVHYRGTLSPTEIRLQPQP